MSTKRTGFSGDIENWLRGLCMGAADIVPGVSGGTIALILGHYERLVTGISHIDTKAINLFKQRKIAQALEYIDFRFLAALAIGMLSGVVALASLMHYLLEHHLAYTYSVFTGLMIVSCYLVACRLEKWSPAVAISMLVGALLAWQICMQQPLDGDLTILSAFLSATVAICAMILPGISGAFVLLLLGVYRPVTELLKGLPKGDFTVDGLIIIAAFLAGCVVGLLSFSRILKWLLANKHDITLAFLVGLMLGSLYKIWPFQLVTEATASLPFKEQIFQHQWPGTGSTSVLLVLVLALAAGAATLSLERIGRSN